ncbi:alpha-sarcoglycan isoform X2 [Homalodisca vitripennis]|uniref:alpha-sarcoglycan isoform X2 n=1 Tax=Homalodisca vitripennis TaxID=197043 RepID=UPI001EEBEDAF|nr:alpha-sarcoglycan isoform X2 [Homalodisca vitripennis]
MNQAVRLFGFLLLFSSATWAEEIHTTKLFIMTVGPWVFDWTDSKGGGHSPNQFSYRPSLLNAPDLPSWMYYTYSERHGRGFVYGAAPPHQKDLQIEVIGLNKKNYEARRRVIKMNVVEKAEPALYEVHLKVDKLNVEDMLDSDRYNRLLDVFRRSLWPESQSDLYITFLASAVQLGARLPLNPFEGEGIVMHIGSRAPFSKTLEDLQLEVLPLRSKGQTNCPDFKHTSVERFFKQYNFSLDWCAFRLVNVTSQIEDVLEDFSAEYNPTWLNQKNAISVSKQELPNRHYMSELALTLVVPLLCLAVLVILLTFILCFQQDTAKRNDDTPQSQLVQYEAVQRASNTLRSLSTQRDGEDSSPRVSMERSGLRPNPPPYSGIHHTTRDEFFDDDDTKTWYC